MDLINGRVRVYNYEMSPIGFPSQRDTKGIFLSGREEDEDYVMERVYWEDIEIENTNSDVFKIGRLRFHPDEEEEIYEKLGIDDRENVVNDFELRKVLQNDDLENLKRINNIKSILLITRMKEMLFRMERADEHIPRDIITVVSERLETLKSGEKDKKDTYMNRILEKEKQNMKDNELKNLVKDLSEKVENLEKQNKDKDSVIEQSQGAIKDLLKMVEDLKKDNKKTIEKEEVTETKKTKLTKEK